MSTTVTCVAVPQHRTLVEEMLNRYLDGDLSIERHGKLFEHLAHCPSCRSQMDSVMAFRRIAREEYISVPPSVDESFLDRLAELKERVDRVDRAGDREPLWQSRRSVSLGTTVLMAACLFVLGLYLPKLAIKPALGPVTGEQEMVDLDAPVFGLLNTVYVITPGVTVESPRTVAVESP